MNPWEEAQKLASSVVDNTTKTLAEAAAAVQSSTTQIAESTLAHVDDLGQKAKAASQIQLDAAGQAMEEWQTAIAGLGSSGLVVTQALKDLPRTAQELAREMPNLARRIQTAGVRGGETPRMPSDVMALFDKIPGTAKLGANERDIWTFLSDKHGSHIRPHTKGGGNGAENIVWEVGRANMQRGAQTMTAGEQLYVRVYNAVDSLLKNPTAIARLGVTATGVAVLTQTLVTALAYTLDLYRGDITIEEFRDKITAAAVGAGIATPIFFLIFIVVMALFPEVVVILSAPAVVAGFNALFGVGIALPIIQSILRHVDAGGFGEEAQQAYTDAIQQGNAAITAASQETQQWWCNLLGLVQPDPGVSQNPNEVARQQASAVMNENLRQAKIQRTNEEHVRFWAERGVKVNPGTV